MIGRPHAWTVTLGLGTAVSLAPTVLGGGDEIIWDNGEPDGSGSCSNTTRDVFGVRRAVLDDFVVPDNEIWRIGVLNHLHQWEGGLPPGTGVGLEFHIRSDLDDVPGPILFTPTITGYTEKATGKTYFSRDGAESWTEFEPFALGPGHYWFEAAMSAPGAGADNRWLWDVAAEHNAPVWINWEDFYEFPVPGRWLRGADVELSWKLIGNVLPVALAFTYPNGRPDLLDPSGDVVRVVIRPVGEAALDGETPTLHYDAGEGLVAVPLEQVTFAVYDAIFPAIDCGTEVRWFVSAATVDGAARRDPTAAPDLSYQATAAVGFEAVFADDFETDRGWTVEGEQFLGEWERGVPLDCEEEGVPSEDGDGSGQCYLTGNDNCDDRLRGKTIAILTSPVMGAAEPGGRIAYHRWFANDLAAFPDEALRIEISGDGGTSWHLLEFVGPFLDAQGGWRRAELRLDGILEPTEHVRIRFTARNDSNSQVEAAVDGVELLVPVCSRLGDIDGDGDVDFADLILLLAAWGPCPAEGECPEDLDGNGVVDFADVLLLLGAWGG